jgi:nicotinamidase-related amidase
MVLGAPIDVPVQAGQTALVCVDIQRKTMDPEAPRGFSRSLVSADPVLADQYFRYAEKVVVPNVQRLQECFRERGWPVMHFAVGPRFADGSDLPFAFRQVQTKGLGTSDRDMITVDDPEFQLVDAVAPLPGEPLIHKVTMGGFTGTGADQLLRTLGIRTIVMVGGHTHACVEATARVAADLGYGVVVVEDAVINYLPVMHDAAMVNFASFIGRVTTTDDLLAELTEGENP